jgi:hypothetical protein
VLLMSRLICEEEGDNAAYQRQAHSLKKHDFHTVTEIPMCFTCFANDFNLSVPLLSMLAFFLILHVGTGTSNFPVPLAVHFVVFLVADFKFPLDFS